MTSETKMSGYSHQLRILEMAQTCQVVGYCPICLDQFEMKIGRTRRDLGQEYDLYCPLYDEALIETDCDQDENIFPGHPRRG